MERFYMGQSTVKKYDKSHKPNVVPIVRAFADFTAPISSPFIGFIVNKLTKDEADVLYQKIEILSNQLSKQFFRIIACPDNRYNKVSLPNIELFNSMYERVKKGKQVDGIPMTSLELADAYLSSLEECIDRNYEAEKVIGVLPDNEPNPQNGLPRGLNNPQVRPYTPKNRGGY